MEELNGTGRSGAQSPIPLWVVVYHRDHIIIINIRELNDVANNLSPL